MAYPLSKKNHTLLALLIISVISGCSSKLNLQPQIDEVNSIRHNDTYPNEGKTIWSVGQWALYKTENASREEVFRLFDGKPVGGFRKISITGQSGASFWLEQHIVWPDHEEHIAALVTGMNQPDANHLKITQLKFTQSDGEVIEINEENLASDTAVAPLDDMQYLLNLLEHSHRKGRIGNITVPAGTFENTNEVPFSMSLRFGKTEGNVLYSYAVPISTMVKLQATQDTSGWLKDTSTWELADFGQSGASSYFSFSKE